jgi:hypothetical protein
LTNVVITLIKINLTNPSEYCKHTFGGPNLLDILFLHSKQSTVPPHQSLNMFPCQWLLTKSLDFASSPQSLTYLHKCIRFDRSNAQRKNKIYLLESSSPSSTVGHFSFQHEANFQTSSIHTSHKKKQVFSFQNLRLLIIIVLPCSTTYIVLLHLRIKQWT